MNKKLTVMTAAAAMSIMMAAPALAGTWQPAGDRWRYQRNAAKYAISEWVDIDAKRYYFDNYGYMVTGWRQVGSEWYYMDESGAMQVGWLKDQDHWYYLSPLNGAMVTNTTIEGRWIGADGVWVPAEGQTEPDNAGFDFSDRYLVQNFDSSLKHSGYTIIASGKTASGSIWNNAIRLYGDGSYVQCDTNGEYKILAGVYAPSTTFNSSVQGILTVYGDNNQVLYNNEFVYNASPISFAADVSGQSQVRVEFRQSRTTDGNAPVLLIDKLSLYK